MVATFVTTYKRSILTLIKEKKREKRKEKEKKGKRERN